MLKNPARSAPFSDSRSIPPGAKAVCVLHCGRHGWSRALQRSERSEESLFDLRASRDSSLRSEWQDETFFLQPVKPCLTNPWSR